MIHPSSTLIRLKKNQWRIYNDRRRFVVVVAGRRFGKTYLAVAKLIETATQKPGSTSWYVAPTYKQAKMIAWKILKSYVPEEARTSINEQELTIVLKNGSEIALKGADNPDSLRGVALDYCVMDEYADMDLNVWGEVIRPMLATTQGRVLFIGTPKGYDHFYELYMAAQATPEYYGAYHFTAMEGGYIPQAEYDTAKNDPTITERQFKQEWHASFENLTGRVYDSFDRNIGTGNLREYTYVDGVILMGLDFNVDPMTASFAQKRGRDINFFAEIGIRNSNTEEMCQETKRRFPGKTIVCFPDPAGNSRSTKGVVGQTDYTIIRRHGFELYDPGRPYLNTDKHNTVNAMLKSANGERHLFFDPKGCPNTIKAFDGLCFKEGTRLPDKKGGLDHWTDNSAYLVLGVAPDLRGGVMSTQEFRV